MIEFVLLAFIIAKLKGYKISCIFKEIIYYPLFLSVLIFILFQVSLILGFDFLINTGMKYYRHFQSFSMISAFIPILKFLPPLKTIVCFPMFIIGSVLNRIAIRANNGFMPVFTYTSKWTGYHNIVEKYNTERHTFDIDKVKLIFLTDIIDTGYIVYSIGDLLILVYVPIILYHSIKQLNINNK
jgi:hypothetical protein